MAEPCGAVKKRRRWPWAILAAIAMLIGGQLAYDLRPLNETERALLGRWHGPGPTQFYEFDEDRRFRIYDTPSRPPFIVGRWTAYDSSIFFKQDLAFGNTKGMPFLQRLQAYFNSKFPPRTTFEWDGPNRIKILHSEMNRAPN